MLSSCFELLACSRRHLRVVRALQYNVYYRPFATEGNVAVAVPPGVVAPPPPPSHRFICSIKSLDADDVGMRADALLRSKFALGDAVEENLPQSLLHNWARRRLIRVQREGALQVLACNDRLRAGDALHLHQDVAKRLVPRRKPQQRGFVELSSAAAAARAAWFHPSLIRHVDERMVVISKPAGVPTQGGTAISFGTSVDDALPLIDAAVNRASSRLRKRELPKGRQTAAAGEAAGLKLVHRLDRDVSGLLILARGRRAAGQLARGFAHGLIRKTYVALVAAELPRGTQLQGSISAPVIHQEFGRVSSRERKQHAINPGAAVPGAARKAASTTTVEEAVTSYTAHPLLLQLGAGDGSGIRGGAAAQLPPSLTLLFLEPHTGRKHQLRQHVLHLFKGQAGILGDDRYCAKTVSSPAARRALRLPPPPGASNTAAMVDAALSVPWPTSLARQLGSELFARRRLMLHSLKAAVPHDMSAQETRDEGEGSEGEEEGSRVPQAWPQGPSGRGAARQSREPPNNNSGVDSWSQDSNGPSPARGPSASGVQLKDPMPAEMRVLLEAYGWPAAPAKLR